MIDSYLKFSPDLIIEATSVCDRICPGCYAPNVVSKESAEKLLLEKPELFIDQKTLLELFSNLFSDEKPKLGLVSIRGGEPTRHPHLASIVEVASKFSENVFIETHGRWILKPEAFNQSLLEVCKMTGATIKLSFDKMHGGDSMPLQEITDYLEKNNINFIIAITEHTESEFFMSRTLCGWIPDKNIIFQKKSRSADDLIKPTIGVVKVNGTFSQSLNSRISFQSPANSARNSSEVVA